MSTRRVGGTFALTLAIAGLLGATTTIAKADTAPDAPDGAALTTVRATLERASAVVQGEGDRNAKLLGLQDAASELLDAPAMARRAAGPALAEQDEALRDEFLSLYERLIVRAYLQKLLFFREPAFDFLSDEPMGDGGLRLVQTEIVTSKDRYAVDYVMRERDGRWWAIDVRVEQASITRNYHRQFERVLRSQSFEELVSRMRRKVDQIAKEDDE